MRAEKIVLNDVVGEELTKFELSDDGRRLRLGFTCPGGTARTLDLPTNSLQSLITSLPRMMEESLKLRYQDKSLRLVYSTSSIRVEMGSDRKSFILTLVTPDGFAVSFGLSEEQVAGLQTTIAEVRSGSINATKPS
jgi:hypothetical protein